MLNFGLIFISINKILYVCFPGQIYMTNDGLLDKIVEHFIPRNIFLFYYAFKDLAIWRFNSVEQWQKLKCYLQYEVL